MQRQTQAQMHTIMNTFKLAICQTCNQCYETQNDNKTPVKHRCKAAPRHPLAALNELLNAIRTPKHSGVRFVICSDGACKDNQSAARAKAGYGFAIFITDVNTAHLDTGTQLATGIGRIPNDKPQTNNLAEATAMLESLRAIYKHDHLRDLAGDSNIPIHVAGDSEMVIRMLNGEISPSTEHLIEVIDEARELRNLIEEGLKEVEGAQATQAFTKPPKVLFSHVTREYNKRADELANQAIQLEDAQKVYQEVEGCAQRCSCASPTPTKASGTSTTSKQRAKHTSLST